MIVVANPQLQAYLDTQGNSDSDEDECSSHHVDHCSVTDKKEQDSIMASREVSCPSWIQRVLWRECSSRPAIRWIGGIAIGYSLATTSRGCSTGEIIVLTSLSWLLLLLLVALVLVCSYLCLATSLWNKRKDEDSIITKKDTLHPNAPIIDDVHDDEGTNEKDLVNDELLLLSQENEALCCWEEALSVARLRACAALGSIGAPSLVSTPVTISVHKTMGGNAYNYVRFVAELVEEHVCLMEQMGVAMDCLKIGSSLSMGLGPFSRCVGRVEQGQSKRRKNIPLPHARAILYQTMIQQSHSLHSIDCHLMERTFEHTDETMNENNDHNYLSECASFLEDKNVGPLERVPAQCLTLSFLALSRNQLGEMLSNIVSKLFQSTLGQNVTVMTGIKDSIQWSKEGMVFLNAAFSTIYDKQKDDQNATDLSIGKRSDPIHSREEHDVIGHMESLIGAAHIALWALQTTSNPPFAEKKASVLGANAASETIVNKDEKLSWWQHIHDMLQQAAKIHTEYHLRFLQPPEVDASSNEEGDSTAVESQTEQNYCQSLQFEDSGQQGTTMKDERDQTSKTDKILVFHGRGTLEDGPRKRRDTARDEYNENAIPTSLLFQELKNRIDCLELAEEMDACPPSHLDEDEMPLVQKSQHVRSDTLAQPNQSKSTPLFLGASGNLLSELKGALMDNTNDIPEQLLEGTFET